MLIPAPTSDSARTLPPLNIDQLLDNRQAQFPAGIVEGIQASVEPFKQARQVNHSINCVVCMKYISPKDDTNFDSS
jgi:hypothetical protein